ncbi:MAG: hypothetical protein IJW30_01360 [Clostridia bacterium]|nr:hypothetical protein [Clostridia bacterium]
MSKKKNASTSYLKRSYSTASFAKKEKDAWRSSPLKHVFGWSTAICVTISLGLLLMLFRIGAVIEVLGEIVDDLGALGIFMLLMGLFVDVAWFLAAIGSWKMREMINQHSFDVGAKLFGSSLAINAISALCPVLGSVFLSVTYLFKEDFGRAGDGVVPILIASAVCLGIAWIFFRGFRYVLFLSEHYQQKYYAKKSEQKYEYRKPCAVWFLILGIAFVLSVMFVGILILEMKVFSIGIVILLYLVSVLYLMYFISLYRFFKQSNQEFLPRT